MAQAIKKIKVGDETHPIDGAFYLGTLTTVAGSGSSGSYKSVRWYVSDCEGVTAPYDGMRIAIKIPLAGVGTAGAILSINGNNDADYHPLAYNVNTVLTTHFPVNSIKVFVYDASATMTCYKTANTSVSVTGVWKADSNYDSNTTITFGTLEYYFRPYVATEALYRYKFVMLDKDNRLVPLTTTNVANGTAVTNQTPTAKAFRPDKIWWYATTTTISAGAVVGAQTLWRSGYNGNNATNGGMAICNFNSTIGTYKLIYLCGTFNKATGLFSLRGGGTASSTQYYTQVPTNTANITLSSYFTRDYDYILLGGTYSSNTYIQLFDNNPMFHFDGTNLVPFDSWVSGDVKSVNNVRPDINGNVSISIPDDSTLVHKTGAEAIAGTKTFSNDDGIIISSPTDGINIKLASSGDTADNNVYFTVSDANSQWFKFDLGNGNFSTHHNAYTYNYTLPDSSGTLALDGDVVHKGTSSSSVSEDIYGAKNFKTSIGRGENGSSAVNYLTASNGSLEWYTGSNVPHFKIYGSPHGALDISVSGAITGTAATGSGIGLQTYLQLPSKGTSSARATLATTDDIAGKANDSDVVHKGTSSSLSNEDIYGTKFFKNSSGDAILDIGSANGIDFSSTWADTTASAVIPKIVPISGKQSWIGTSGNRFAQSHVVARYGNSISLTGNSPNISVGDTASIPHSILSDGHLKLSSGSGSDSPAYIDFTGVSGNSGTVTLKSSNLSSGTKTVVIPAKDGTLAIDDEVVHKTGTETKEEQKTFSTAPIISQINSPTSTVAYFRYDNSEGSSIRTYGHFTAFGDNDNSNTYKPTDQTGFDDLDTYYFNTGITLCDAEGNDVYKLSFPAESGTLELVGHTHTLSI